MKNEFQSSGVNQSAAIDQLMNKLMNVQEEFGVIINKDRKGHKSSYASLPRVLESIHKMCSKHGLILTQHSRVIEGKPGIETVLYHPESKQWTSCLSLLTPNPDWPNPDQSWGGSNTYHRRYDAMALLGIFAEDDPSDDEDIPMPAVKTDKISSKQFGLLMTKVCLSKELQSKVMEHFKVNSLEDINWRDFNDVLRFIDQCQFQVNLPDKISRDQVEQLDIELVGYSDLKKDILNKLNIKSFSELEKSKYQSSLSRIREIKQGLSGVK